jgi:hypothetical protein
MGLADPSSRESAFDGGKLLLFCSISLSFDSSTIDDAVQLFDIDVMTCVGVDCVAGSVGSKSSSKMFEERTFRTTSVRDFLSMSSSFHCGASRCIVPLLMCQ